MYIYTYMYVHTLGPKNPGSLFYRRKWGAEVLRDLPEVAPLRGARVSSQDLSSWPQLLALQCNAPYCLFSLVFCVRTGIRRFSIVLFDLSLRHVQRMTSFSFLCACPWMTAKAPWVFILGLQINFSEEANLQLWDLQIRESRDHFLVAIFCGMFL